MGAKNLLLMLVGLPFIFSLAVALILYERAHDWMKPIQYELMYRLDVSADKYSIMILFVSLALCYLCHFMSVFVAAWYRSKDWDNSTTRNVPEKQIGLSYRCVCAHLNEGEQFRYIAVAVIISLVLMSTEGKDSKLSLDFMNYCCTGYIVHRLLYHAMFILNIDFLRSFHFQVSFGYSILLFLSTIYGVQTTNNSLAAMIPPQFKEFDITKLFNVLN